jgi:Tat protein translocase TatB subunit
MNVFSNIGITELIVILLLALLVVGPERLPEMGRQLAKILRDVRKAYENLTRDLGPEFMSIQQTTQELRQSVDSVRSIPQDMIQSVVKAADMDDTIQELKGVTNSIGQVGETMSKAGKTIKDPIGTAVSTARAALLPSAKAQNEQAEHETPVEKTQATEEVLVEKAEAMEESTAQTGIEAAATGETEEQANE